MTSPIPVTPADAARIYNRSIASIYRLAHYYEWNRVRYNGRIYYDQRQLDRNLNTSPEVARHADSV
jgi:hypothetical protein